VSRRVAFAGLAWLLAAAAAGESRALLDRYALDADSMRQWRLPERLREISGLALDPEDRLFAVGDEHAIIYELDWDSGRLVKAFALGDPVLREDFEGIAIVAGRFYMVTSGGDFYESAEGRDGEQLDYERYSTGLGERCEIEGLAATRGGDRLLIACKEPRGGHAEIEIHAWSPESRRLLPGEMLTLPLADILPSVGATRLNPSGIVVVPENGNLLIVAARQRALVELSPDGRVLAALPLPLAHRHRQPEGIELATDGRLLVADEGGSHKARLAVYQPRASGDDRSE